MIIDKEVSIPSQDEELARQIARWEEMARESERLNDSNHLPVVSMRELFETIYPSKSPIIDGLLYPGLYLIAGASKIGKSFLMAQIAYHVSSGQSLRNYPVRKGTVLYLALEDDYQRLQQRMFRMFGMDGNETLFSPPVLRDLELAWMSKFRHSCKSIQIRSWLSSIRCKKFGLRVARHTAMLQIVMLSAV